MKTVYEASNSIEAYILKGLLATFEINAFVHGEHLQSGAGELPMTGCVRLMVDQNDYTQARMIITDWEHARPTSDALDAQALGDTIPWHHGLTKG